MLELLMDFFEHLKEVTVQDYHKDQLARTFFNDHTPNTTQSNEMSSEDMILYKL